MSVCEMYGNEGEIVSTAFKFWRNSIIFQLQTEQPIIKVTNYYTISSSNSSRQTVELMTAKTPFRLFAFIQDLDWIFWKERQSDYLQLRALFLPTEGLWNVTSNHNISSPDLQGTTTFLHSMNQTDCCRLIFSRIVCSLLFHSQNGQFKYPDTKLLVPQVTADEDCRLIFAIWWINRADQQSDQHETEI